MSLLSNICQGPVVKKMRPVLFLVFAVHLAVSLAVSSDEQLASFEPEKTLLSKCPTSPNFESPILSTDETLNVTILLVVNRFFDLDEVSQSFPITGTIQAKWKVPCVAQLYQDNEWPSKIRLVSLQPDRFWWPFLVHRNSLTESMLEFKKERNLDLNMVTGEFTGSWSGIWESFCDFDMIKFPFDRQNCEIHLNSLQSLDLVRIQTAKAIVLPNSVGTNWNWQLTGNSSSVSTTSDVFQPSNDVYFTFNFKRIPSYHLLTLLFPASILEALAGCAVLLPKHTPDRTAFVATIVLAFYFLQTDFNSRIPQSPKPTYSNIYLLGLLTCCTLIAIYSAVFCFIENTQPRLAKRKIKFCGRLVNLLFFLDICLYIVTATMAGFIGLFSIGMAIAD